MSRSVMGFALMAISVVGILASFGTLDSTGAIGLDHYGLAWGLSNARAFGSLPLGLTVAALLGIGLVGAGLLVFRKSEPTSPDPEVSSGKVE